MNELPDALLARAGELVPLTPPVDVELLAKRLGVVEIERASLVEDGRFEPHGDGGSTIVLRLGNGRARERFTLAHEIGHLMLAEGTGDLSPRRRDGAWDLEERICDRFAAELLLPRTWLHGRVRGECQGLTTLKAIAGEAEVSLSASLIALQSVAGWNRSLLRWRRASVGRWALASAVGTPRAMRRGLRSDGGTSEVLEQLRAGESRLVEDLPMTFRQDRVLGSGEVMATGRSRIALLDLAAAPVR